MSLNITRPDVSIAVVDDFSISPFVDENGRPRASHGYTTSVVAEQASQYGSSNVLNIDTGHAGTSDSDIKNALMQILDSPSGLPKVVNMSLGMSPSSNFTGLMNNKYSSEWSTWDAYAVRSRGAEIKDLLKVALEEYEAASKYFDEPAVKSLIRELVDRGTTVVVSAVNSGVAERFLKRHDFSLPDGFKQNLLYGKRMPAGVIVVGASKHSETQSGNNAADFTRRSPYVDLAADGVDVPVSLTLRDKRTGREVQSTFDLSGTSYSAPYVAGLVADMLFVNPDLTPAQIERILKDTAQASPGERKRLGAGIVDRDLAMAMAELMAIKS